MTQIGLLIYRAKLESGRLVAHQFSINVLVQIFTSAYFNMGLLMKALEITWDKPMYMQYIFPCGVGMHLLIAGFASIQYLHGETGLGEFKFEFKFEFVFVVCDCGIS